MQKSHTPATIDNIIIEKDHGLIKSKFSGNSNKFIINIQDAHCNYEAQTNIVNILEGLIKNHSLGLISVEGADGLIDTTWFKAFPDEEVRKEVAAYFMKKGEITGPEFLSITKNYPIKLFGAEDRAAYIQNLNAFTSSYPLKAETEKYYNSIKGALNRLKGFIYSDNLKAMDAKSQDYESKKMQFNDYIRFLQSMAEKCKINLRSYENLFRLVSVLAYEKKINFNVTDKERAGLIDEISKAISKDALTEMVSKSIAFKSGAISSVEFYNYLKKTAIQNNIDLSVKYPNLYNYIIYNSVYSKIDNEKLFNEIKALEAGIKEKLFTSDDQRTLDKLSRHIDILIGMANIKLLNGDFNYYQTHRGEFTHEIFTDFIRKESVKYGLAYEAELPSEAVAKSMPKLEEFYVIATKRDKALVDNTIKEMDRQKQQFAVLVTGGFHSEGMSKLLEKRGISYIVVCPSITKDVPTPYIQVLTNQRTPIEDILVSPDAAKKGMLAPMLRSRLIRVDSGITRELAATGKDFEERWVARSIEYWFEKALPAVRSHELARDENTMKAAYASGMRISLTNLFFEEAGFEIGNVEPGNDPGSERGAAIDRRANEIVDAILRSPVFDAIFAREFAKTMPRVGDETGAIRGNGEALTAAEHGPRTRAHGADVARTMDKRGTVNGIIENKILMGQAFSLRSKYIRYNPADIDISPWLMPAAMYGSEMQEHIVTVIRQVSGSLTDTNIVIVRGLSRELIKQGVAPDLYLHFGVTRTTIYIDEEDFLGLASMDEGRDLLLEGFDHEMAHIRNPDSSENSVEEIAPSQNIRKALAKVRLQAEIKGAAVISAKMHAPLVATTNPAAVFMNGGYNKDGKQIGYGVPVGAAVDGSHAIGKEGNQGYYVEGGKKIFVDTVESMKQFFQRRAARLGKPIRFIIKPGIGGQHTPFQGISEVFELIDAGTGKIVGEYELGKNYEDSLRETLKKMDASWDQIAVIPSSKSGSTDETMMIFSEIFYTLLKNVAVENGFAPFFARAFADTVFEAMHDNNYPEGKERSSKDLFKGFSLFAPGSVKDMFHAKGIGISSRELKDIFGTVLGNMFFETTDRPEQSRLSAFIRNSELSNELDIRDIPGFGAMFDNVGGRWTGDLHMMTLLAYHNLDAAEYWDNRYKGIVEVREGRHPGYHLGNKIADEGITDIALVVPDEFFWFGKAMEQNFNESIWQKGFANLVAIKQSAWEAQKKHYASKPDRMVINLSRLGETAIPAETFNVVNIPAPNTVKTSKQELADAMGGLFTTFYGMTNTVGNRLIVKALAEKGYTPEDVDLNDLNNPATRIFQQNLYLRQPYVELGKGMLEKKLAELQAGGPGAINEEFAKIQQAARNKSIESNITEFDLPQNIGSMAELARTIQKAAKFAEENNRKFVPFIYTEGRKYQELRDHLTMLGIEWVMQGTGDQHISYQQVLAQPQKYMPFIVSFVPVENPAPGRPAIGFAKGYLNNVSPHMVRDLFAKASYDALTQPRKDEAGREVKGAAGVFMRLTDTDADRVLLRDAFDKAAVPAETSGKTGSQVAPGLPKERTPSRPEPAKVFQAEDILTAATRDARTGARNFGSQDMGRRLLPDELTPGNFNLSGMTAEEIMAFAGTSGVKSLNATAVSLKTNQELLVKEGKVLIVRIGKESRQGTDQVAQRIGQKLDNYLPDLVINVRTTKDKAVEAAAAYIGKGDIRAVIAINEDGALIDTAEGKAFQAAIQGLHAKSRILDVQSTDSDGNPLSVPVPAIYDLALRLGFDQVIDGDFAAFLGRIGLFLDANGEPIDPLKMSTYFVIRIIPRARPVNMNADAEAQRLTKEAVDKSL
ncbi:MAG: hypothetical protein PHI58_01275 [Candidatus Omnitrophica bacterium]|nr:hypothetical protein [Candidatus Omnitrophota bacterium]